MNIFLIIYGSNPRADPTIAEFTTTTPALYVVRFIKVEENTICFHNAQGYTVNFYNASVVTHDRSNGPD
jgi:hypothetical protein